jgi:hypothetical protein
MNLGSCTNEREVSDLLKRGCWPHAFPAELRAHVTVCRACGERVLVSDVFRRAKAEAVGTAPLQSSGLLWWRAQLRRRNTAMERVARPVLGAQIFALAVTLLAGSAFFASQARSSFFWISWLRELPRALHFEALLPATLPGLDGSLWLLIPALATLALICGVAVLLASEKH